jgi:ankyrin repeat protein
MGNPTSTRRIVLAASAALAIILSSCASLAEAIGTDKRGTPATIDSSPPLTRAIRIEEYEQAAALIRKRVGLGEKLRLDRGSTPIELAAMHGRLDLVRALLDAGGHEPEAAEYALIRAVQKGHGDIAEYLKSSGVRVGSTSAVYRHILESESEPIYRLLLDAPHRNFGLDKKNARIKFYEKGPLLPNAVILGSLALVEATLAKGAGVEGSRSEGDYIDTTPLWLASAYGRSDIARLLVESGAVIDARDRNYKYTPLMLACMTGNEALARLLIAKRADVNARSASAFTADFSNYGSYYTRTIANLKQRTPLMFAAEGGYPALVRLLLASGADPKASNDDGWTALDAARTNLDATICRMLLEAGTEENPLITAVCAGDAVKVRELLPRLADFTGTKKKPVYPLTLAVKWQPVTGSRATIDALLGAKDSLSPNDVKAALRAAKSGDEELFLYLSSKGLRLIDEGYYSAMDLLRVHTARDDAKSFAAVWDREVSALPSDGAQKLLKEAVKAGKRRIAEFLLDNGGDPGAYVNGEMYDLFGYAAVAGHGELAALLLDRGAQANPKLANKYLIHGPMLSPLMSAARGGHTVLVKRLLGMGADVRAIGFEGRTPLYYAAAEGHADIVRLILDAGADPDLRMEVLIPGSGGFYQARGETALMAAARYGRTDALRALLAAGADPRLTDWIGDDALVMALENGHRECALLLKEALRK